ncbi:MAG: type II/IV secretion system protein [Bacteroidales bacterium]|nr:type II/IV secretion system protein [Bacteroidales bacterium]
MLTDTLSNIPLKVLQKVTADQAWHYHIIPAAETNDGLEFFVDSRVNDAHIIPELEILFGSKVRLVPVDTALLEKALSRYFPQSRGSKKTQIRKRSEDFLHELILEAYTIGSSDIHIENYEKENRIRLRIDGKLVERYTVNPTEYPALINKIKIMANLDIAEKRLPQDGRILFKEPGNEVDIRVSVLPALFGEKIVLRLLNKDTTDIHIDNLGFGEQQIKLYLEGTRKSNGIILISGPTGSGKTTTLYATLKVLNRPELNILTVEDPIEYTLEGINQVQLKEAIGLTFASAMRTFLRQDPDIIMVGEIRDPETAQMAIRAALTGHLVLSTIHTNSALGTITRLLDMGVPGYLIANTLNLSVAQRLVRLLCPECKTDEEFNPALLPSGYKPAYIPARHSVAKGCSHCFYSGYKGRKAVYEVLPVDEEISSMIRAQEITISKVQEKTGLTLLHESAWRLFEQRLTSLEEIYPILLTESH